MDNFDPEVKDGQGAEEANGNVAEAANAEQGDAGGEAGE